MLGRIYLITNAIDGKKYVGQTIKPIVKRLKEHFEAAFSEIIHLKLSKIFNVTLQTITKIVGRQRWKYI